MKFTPKRDLWLSTVIWISIVLLLVSSISPFFIEGAGLIGGIFIFFLCFSMASFLAWLWLGTYYIIYEDVLLIRSGPITRSIPCKNILKVKPIRSWLASTATSSRRLEICYDRFEYVHISPMDEETFLKELLLKCPHASIKTR